MNSCILMAQILQDPELRYTADNQIPIAQMLVEFPSQRAEDPPARIRVVGWNNLANEIKEKYSAGDRVLIVGSLSMNTIDRQEGFKEKRAELTASRIYKLGADTEFESHAAAVPANTFNSPAPVSSGKSNNVVVPLRQPRQPEPVSNTHDMDEDYASESAYEAPAVRTSTAVTPENQADLDDIPF